MLPLDLVSRAFYLNISVISYNYVTRFCISFDLTYVTAITLIGDLKM